MIVGLVHVGRAAPVEGLESSPNPANAQPDHVQPGSSCAPRPGRWCRLQRHGPERRPPWLRPRGSTRSGPIPVPPAHRVDSSTSEAKNTESSGPRCRDRTLDTECLALRLERFADFPCPIRTPRPEPGPPCRQSCAGRSARLTLTLQGQRVCWSRNSSCLARSHRCRHARCWARDAHGSSLLRHGRILSFRALPGARRALVSIILVNNAREPLRLSAIVVTTAAARREARSRRTISTDARARVTDEARRG